MKKYLCLAWFLILLSGCAYVERGYWIKADTDCKTFSQDFIACKRSAMSGPHFMPVAKRNILLCMQAKGYHWELDQGGFVIEESMICFDKAQATPKE